MKKHFLFLFILCGLTRFVSAQSTIPNAGFEFWKLDSLPPEPDKWKSTNPLAYEATGLPNVTRETSMVSGNYAIKIENVDDGQGNVIYGAAIIGGLPDVQNFVFPGGFPISGKPDSLVFYYKCNIASGDVGLIGVIMKQSGQMIGLDTVQITGIQNNYVRVSRKITYFIPFTPDSVWIGILSGDLINNTAQVGSKLWVDDIQLIRNSGPLTTNVPNGGFENWVVQNFEDPDNWGTTNKLTGFEGLYSATKSTDKHNGNYSLRIETITVNDGADTVGIATTGKTKSSGNITGGFPFTSHPHFLGFWYKYSRPAFTEDSAMAGVFFIKKGVVVDSVMGNMGPSSTWQYKEIFLGFDTALHNPDSLNIVFTSSHFYGDRSTVAIGSVLNVDDVMFRVYATAVNESEEVIESYLVYPNPANGELQFNFQRREAADVNLRTFDITGRQIDLFSAGMGAAGSANVTVNTASYPAGVYLYQLSCGEQIISGKFTIAR